MKKIIVNVILLSSLLRVDADINASGTSNFGLVGSLKNNFYYGSYELAKTVENKLPILVGMTCGSIVAGGTIHLLLRSFGKNIPYIDFIQERTAASLFCMSIFSESEGAPLIVRGIEAAAVAGGYLLGNGYAQNFYEYRHQISRK